MKTLIASLSKLGSSSTGKDVEKVVTAAGDTLDEGPNGETYMEEIEALLAQEGYWKEMAEKSDPELKAIVTRFMERFGECMCLSACIDVLGSWADGWVGIIPMGALEAAESGISAT